MRYSVILKIIGVTILVFIICFTLALTVRTLSARPADSWNEPENKENLFTDDDVYERLAEAIKFPTISYDPLSEKTLNETAFNGLKDYIIQKFPTVLGNTTDYVSSQFFNNYTLLVTVNGSNPLLKPYMLSAHLDVVPVDEGEWIHGPFDGLIDDTFIWGRGALDDKHNLIGILEAVEYLLKEKGFRPNRTLYIAFGHDEEIGGHSGAKLIADHLSGKKLEFIMDEGLLIANGSLPGVSRPISLIGVSEKGSLTVKITAYGTPGHSSMPPLETPITKLARVLTKFTNNAHPAYLTDLQTKMMQNVAHVADFPLNVVFSNLWLFGPFVRMAINTKPLVSPAIKTTTAVTKISGGEKDNIVPGKAEAIVNHRVLPGFTLDEILEYDRNLVKDIENVTVEVLSFDDNTEAIPSSPFGAESFGYQMISKTVSSIFSSAIVAPSVMIGNTDSRQYYKAGLTEAIYRFSPININIKELEGIHGVNERLAKDQYTKLCKFYVQLIYNCDAESVRSARQHDEF